MKLKHLLIILILGLLLLVTISYSIILPSIECFITYRYEVDGEIKLKTVQLDNMNAIRHAFSRKHLHINWNSGESPGSYDSDYAFIFKYPLGISIRILIPIVDETRRYGFNGTLLEIQLDEREHNEIMTLIRSLTVNTDIITR